MGVAVKTAVDFRRNSFGGQSNGRSRSKTILTRGGEKIVYDFAMLTCLCKKKQQIGFAKVKSHRL